MDQRCIAGRYRLVRPLGQGGMGRVWLAHDETLRRDVAVKELVPAPGLSADEQCEMRERSMREARAIARLDDVNVIRVFDVLHAGGEPWIVMEYVPSRSLQQVVAEDGPVPPTEAARIGLAVLAGLRAAHRAGLLHRDVKPANVLLAEDGRVVLTDFGLATAPDDPSMTRTGIVLGSPEYLAPERVVGDVGGPAADLWSLGATLYTAVEGQPPYVRPSALATVTALATEPPAPAARAGALAPVLQALLRKDPSQRVAAGEAERLLRNAAAGQSAPPGRRARPRKSVAVLVAVVVLAGGATAYRLGGGSGTSERAQRPAVPVSSLAAPSAAVPVPAPRPPPTSSPTASPTRYPARVGVSTATRPPAAGPQPVATGVVTHPDGAWCMDLRPPNVWVWDCNHTSAQTWTLRTDGRVSASGDTTCVTPANDAGTVGTTIGVSACSATDRAQVWRQQANSTIVNAASGLCLSPGTLGYTSPFALQACTGDSLQQWRLPTA